MTAGLRAAIGALVGAALTLFAHPASRPFVSLGNSSQVLKGAQRAFDTTGNPERLTDPGNLLEASLWMQFGARRLQDKKPLGPRELSSLLTVASAAQKAEIENAFWPQMLAIFSQVDARPEDARRYWLRAAKCTYWNDYQSTRLVQGVGRLRREGEPRSWPLAYAYRLRSEAVPRQIERFARNGLRNSDLHDRPGLEFRYATLINGELLRTNSKNVKLGTIGSDVVELASYPPNLASVGSPYRLIIARNEFINALRKVGLNEQADRTRIAFLENESWLALTGRERRETKLEWHVSISVVCATLGAALAICAVIGGFVWMVGSLMGRWTQQRSEVGQWAAALSGGLLGGVIWWITGLLVAGIAIMVCMLFLSLGPKAVRASLDENVGPLFTFVVSTIGLAFTASLVMYLLSRAAPTTLALPTMGVNLDYYGPNSLFAGVAAILFAMLFLVAALWAIVQHRGTVGMVRLTLRRFGAFVGTIGLLGCVVGTPLLMVVDREFGRTLEQLLTNEPVYYLSR